MIGIDDLLSFRSYTKDQHIWYIVVCDNEVLEVKEIKEDTLEKERILRMEKSL